MKETVKPVSAEKVSDDVRTYINLRIASAKLALVEGLSKVAGNAVRVLVFLLLCTMAFIAFAVALGAWLATLLGSVAIAALIVGLILFVIALVTFAVKGLFINPMVGMFSDMFFKPRKYHHDEDE